MPTRCFTLPALALLLVLAGAAGCCCGKVEYVDPNSNEGLTTVQGIDFQDWGNAATQMTNALLASGTLDRTDGRKNVIMVSKIENKTHEHIDTDLLLKKIRIALNESGKAVTTTAVGIGGPEDEASMGVRDLRKSDEFDQSTTQPKGAMKAPDFSLSGKIIEMRTAAGSTKQSAFAFQLSLTDLKTGTAPWEKEVNIIKKGKKAGVGW